MSRATTGVVGFIALLGLRAMTTRCPGPGRSRLRTDRPQTGTCDVREVPGGGPAPHVRTPVIGTSRWNVCPGARRHTSRHAGGTRRLPADPAIEAAENEAADADRARRGSSQRGSTQPTRNSTTSEPPMSGADLPGGSPNATWLGDYAWVEPPERWALHTGMGTTIGNGTAVLGFRIGTPCLGSHHSPTRCPQGNQLNGGRR
jgi:hypothetical protein